MKTHRLMSSALLTVLLFSTGEAFAHLQNKLDSTTTAKVDGYLTDSINNGFSGAVMLSEKGIKRINKGYGMADKEKKTVNGPKTIFDLGSNTKQFTAAAILVLVQQGHLKLTDPIAHFFKDLPNEKQAITIHQLLIHTSGLKEAIGHDFEAISEVDFFRQVFASELLFPIGSEHSYSNIGYSLLAKIIESTSKLSYESFLRKHLFIPSGMHNTGYLKPKWQQQHLAIGYSRGVMNQGSMVERYHQQETVYWHLKGNGGINSTQEDMFLWFQALKNNTVLTAEYFTLMTTAYSVIFDSFYYGYGWAISQSTDHTKRISHNGSNGSFAHNIIWFPEEDILLLFSTNAASPVTEAMANTIEKIIFQADFVAEPIKKNPYLFVFDFIKDHGHSEAEKLMALIRAEHLEDFSVAEILNRIGYTLLRDQQLLWAIEIFKINTELFANDSNAWDSLGDAYLADHQNNQAKQSFEKAIQLGGQVSIPKLNKLK